MESVLLQVFCFAGGKALDEVADILRNPVDYGTLGKPQSFNCLAILYPWEAAGIH